MSQAGGGQPAVEPLTRRNADGELYRRDPEVERQILDVLGLKCAALLRRAALADKRSAGYLKEESLVYLIRRAARQGQARTINDLTALLLRRCTPLIHRRLASLRWEAFQDAYAEAVATLFGRILDLESDHGDFVQVRFWFAVERIVIRAFDEQVSESNRDRKIVSLSELADYDRDDAGIIAVQTGTGAGCDQSIPETVVIQRDLIGDALDHIEEPRHRTAFLLRYVAGWPIETKDPTARSISGYFGKAPNTIRTWLCLAKEALRRWKATQQ